MMRVVVFLILQVLIVETRTIDSKHVEFNLKTQKRRSIASQYFEGINLGSLLDSAEGLLTDEEDKPHLRGVLESSEERPNLRGVLESSEERPNLRGILESGEEEAVDGAAMENFLEAQEAERPVFRFGDMEVLRDTRSVKRRPVFRFGNEDVLNEESSVEETNSIQ